MKITVFGSTGQLGRLIVSQALGKGYEVVAFARNSSKLNIENSRLSIIEGDITNSLAVDSAVKGSNAIISALNTNNSSIMPITKGVRNIIISMNKYNVRRLIMSAPVPGIISTNDSKSLKFSLACGLIRFILMTFSRNSFIDLKTSCIAVQNSHVDWTLVRIFPTNKSMKYNVKSGFINSKMSLTVTRSDAASFMLAALYFNETISQTLFICN
jgi:hypothetical protein